MYIFKRSGSTWSFATKLTPAGLGLSVINANLALSGNTLLISGRPGAASSAPTVVKSVVESGGNWSIAQSITLSQNTLPETPVLDISGNYMAIGRPAVSFDARGTVQVYRRDNGTWNQIAALIATDSAANDQFGAVVAIDGCTVAVGAPGNANDAGALYLFGGTGTGCGTWSQLNRFIYQGSQASYYKRFPRFIALSGDYLAAQPPLSNTPVLTYQRISGSWTFQTSVDYAGYDSLTIDGTTLYSGIPFGNPGGGSLAVAIKTINGYYNQGSFSDTDTTSFSKFGMVSAINKTGTHAAIKAMLYKQTVNGTNYAQVEVLHMYDKVGSSWVFQQTIDSQLSNSSFGRNSFGATLALDGDTLAVGTSDLSVTIYKYANGLWTKQQILKDEFTGGYVSPYAIAIDNGTLAFGAGPRSSDPVQSGKVYTFAEVNGVWTQQQVYYPNDGEAYDGFGYSLAFSGDTMMVGSPYKGTGAIYEFTRTGGTWSQTQKLTTPVASTNFGSAVDFKGNTLAVGATNTAFVFSRVGGAWAFSTKLESPRGDSVFGGIVRMVDPYRVLVKNGACALAALFTMDGNGVWSSRKLLTGSDCTDNGADTIAIAGNDVLMGNVQAQGYRGRVYEFNLATPTRPDTIGIYRRSNNTFYLKNTNVTGYADVAVQYGINQNAYPVTGDWNNDGIDTIGIYDRSLGNFYLRNSNTPGPAEISFALGIPGDQPIAGHWTSDMLGDGAGVFRPSNGILYLRKTLTTGYADYSAVMGIAGDIGVAGDWNGDGNDSVGVYRPNEARFYIINNNTPSGVTYAESTFLLGVPNDYPVVGDWTGIGSSGAGVFRVSDGQIYLKNQPTTGYADTYLVYGIANDIPVAGRWTAPSAPAPRDTRLANVIVGPNAPQPALTDRSSPGAE